MFAEGIRPDCVSADPGVDALASVAAEAGFGIICPSAPDTAWFVGLDEHGLLHLPVLCQLGQAEGQLSAADIAKDIVAQAGTVDDSLILVRSDFLAGPDSGTALRQAMAMLSSAPENAVASIANFGIANLPENRSLALVNIVRRGRLLGELEFRNPDAAERELFVEDARLAWSYFSRFADAKTALVPGTWRRVTASLIIPL